jgi:hypothetical protein
VTTGVERWRHPRAAGILAADASRVFLLEHEYDQAATLVVVDAASGRVLTRMTVGDVEMAPLTWSVDHPTRAVTVIDGWLLGLGDLPAPEQARPTVVRGRLRVSGCPDDGPPSPLVGVRVTIAGATAVTDRRGRFRMRTDVTRAPVAIRVDTATPLDTGFPTTAVLDGRPLELMASYLGAGCHRQ